MYGEEQILPTIGPLSTSLAGCKLFIKTLLDAQPWFKEPNLLPFPWKTEEFFKEKKLKIAVLWDDGVVKVHPPVTRAIKQVVEKLKEKRNIEIVEWKPWKHDLAWEIIVRFPRVTFLHSNRKIRRTEIPSRSIGKPLFRRWRRRREGRNRSLLRTLAPPLQTHYNRKSLYPTAYHPLSVGSDCETRGLPC
jgi:Asp-tRNA(Asn)/Glu-tRNA(Gln) amidotransferase A subunit family amidase